jgi:hypothetical protein
LKDSLRVVVFNACFARGQARAVVDVIDCAVGINDEIGDDAAIVFSGSFYRALGFGRSVQEAFDQGKVAIMFEGIPEEHVPELLANANADPSKIVLVSDSTPEEPATPSVVRSVSIGGNMVGGVVITGDGNRFTSPDSGPSSAAAVWAEKLAFLQRELAIASDAAQKFRIKQQIEEAQRKIAEFG